MANEPPIERAPLCEACGYDLRGRAEGLCPECGRPFDLVSVFFEADAEVKLRWRTWQTAALASGLCPFMAVLVCPFPLCVTWIIPPGLFVIATLLVARGLAWHNSKRGVRLLAACTPGIRLDYDRTMRNTLILHALLAGGALVVGSVLLSQ